MSGIEFLLDTNVVIGLLKSHPPAVALVEQAGMTLERAAISQITRMELLGYPQLTDAEDVAIRNLLAACRVLMIDERIEAEAIRLRRGGALKLPDAIVAATARITEARLLTLDQRLVQSVATLSG